jgi:hypothetical protein
MTLSNTWVLITLEASGKFLNNHGVSGKTRRVFEANRVRVNRKPVRVDISVAWHVNAGD